LGVRPAKSCLSATAPNKSSAGAALLDYLGQNRAGVLCPLVAPQGRGLSALTAQDVEAIAQRHLLAAG